MALEIRCTSKNRPVAGDQTFHIVKHRKKADVFANFSAAERFLYEFSEVYGLSLFGFLGSPSSHSCKAAARKIGQLILDRSGRKHSMGLKSNRHEALLFSFVFTWVAIHRLGKGSEWLVGLSTGLRSWQIRQIEQIERLPIFINDQYRFEHFEHFGRTWEEQIRVVCVWFWRWADFLKDSWCILCLMHVMDLVDGLRQARARIVGNLERMFICWRVSDHFVWEWEALINIG